MPRKSLEGRLGNKFFKGAFRLGAYLGVGTVVASLMACDHLPVPISVSGERYVSYAATDNGDVYALRDGPYNVDRDTTMNLSLVTYDTVTSSVINTHDLPSPPLMLTNSRNSAAYIVPGDDGSTNIAFLNNGRLKTIKDASFPQLSKAGDCLAYSKMKENATLYLDYFKAGNVKKTGINGIPIAFSPNLDRLLFFGDSKNDNSDEEILSVGINYYHLPSGTTTHIIDMILDKDDLPQFPQWVGNDRVLYVAKQTKSSSYNEIHVTDLRGNMITITDNYLTEISPQISEEGIIFYVGKEIKEPVGTESPVYFSKTEKGFWNSQKSNFSAQWLRIAGKNLIYARDGGQLFSVPLEDIVNGNKTNVVNISQKVVAKRN